MMAAGLNLRAMASASSPRLATRALKPLLVRQVQQDARESGVVLHDQQRLVAGLDGYRGRPPLPPGPPARLRCAHWHKITSTSLDDHPARAAVGLLRKGCGHVRLRQVQREHAALAGNAFQADLAAQQARDLAADGKAQSGAAVLAAGGSVGLLERLEDDLLLLRWNADAGILHRERHHVRGAVQHRMVRRASPPWRGPMRSVTDAVLGELERIRKQILQHLLQPLQVGGDGPRQIGLQRRR